jgi:hypothetical protein
MKTFQLVIRNEYIIDPYGNKNFKLNNNEVIEKKILEGYCIKSIYTDSSIFCSSKYKGEAEKSSFFSEIFVLELNKNISQNITI